MRAPSIYTGKGVVIAYIDAGFSMHPDIHERVLVHVDASTAQIKVQERVENLTPASWHGQMVSVIAAGDGHNSGGLYRGLASESQAVFIKVSTPQMAVKEIDILRGINWLIGHHARYKVRIANISVGGDFVSTDPANPLHAAVRDLTALGVVVTIAAGNHSTNYLLPPASAPEAITVGGYSDENTVDRRFWQGYGNNYGHSYNGVIKPDVIGPARWIASPLLPESPTEKQIHYLAPLLHDITGKALERLLEEGREVLGIDADAPTDNKLYAFIQDRINYHKIVNAHYQHVDGTSVAAPIVASLIAQMLEANPLLTPVQIKQILIKTARLVHGIANERQGAGAVNAADAIAAAEALI